MSDYENDDYETVQGTEVEDTEVAPAPAAARKKFAPIKDVTAKRAQALKNLEKARETKLLNAQKKKKEAAKYEYSYSESESESSESEVELRSKSLPSRSKSKPSKRKPSSIDDEFKRTVLQTLSELKKKVKRPERNTYLNVQPAKQTGGGSDAVQDTKRRQLLDMFN